MNLKLIESIIAENLTITDQRLMDGVIGAVMDAVDAERAACCAIVYGQCGSDNVAQRTVDAIRARDGEPETYCHTYYHIETGACIQHGEWSRTAGLGCPGCNGEIEKEQLP